MGHTVQIPRGGYNNSKSTGLNRVKAIKLVVMGSFFNNLVFTLFLAYSGRTGVGAVGDQ